MNAAMDLKRHARNMECKHMRDFGMTAIGLASFLGRRQPHANVRI
jgi:hypothetical protein